MRRNSNLLTAGCILALAVTLQSGCAETATVTKPTAKAETGVATQPAPVPQRAAEPAPVIKAASLTGKVTETMDSGGYTYVNMEKDGKTFWVALPPTKVKVGDDIEVRPGMQMGRFTSKTLNRTFEEITFSSGLVTGAKPQLPPGHQPAAARTQVDQEQSAKDAIPQQKSHGGMMALPGAEMTAISGKVVETMDASGYTYVNLESDGKTAWAAIPATKVTVGQQLTLQPGRKMTNFTSKSLNKTFDSIIFSGGILPAAK